MRLLCFPTALPTALLPAALLLGGCHEDALHKPPPGASAVASAAPAPVVAAAPVALPTREGASIARSVAGDALYLADEDHAVVRRIALPFDPAAPDLAIPMPGLPAQVLVLGDRVLVTVRSEGGKPEVALDAKGVPPATAPASPVSPTGPGLLLVFRPDPAAGLVEVARVALPADAWGIAVTPDQKTALVSSAWTHRISAVDLASAKQLWSIDVPREPRAIVVRPDGVSAYVTHLVGGVITRLDDLPGKPRAHPVALPPSPLRSPSGKTLDGTLAYSAALSPDGGRFFVARHALGALGEAAWFGAATVDVLVTATDTPLAPMREANLPLVKAKVANEMDANSRESKGNVPLIEKEPFAEPRALVYRRRTSSLLVASEGTNQLVELDARSIDPTMFVKRRIELGADFERGIRLPRSGGAPSGIALSADESIAWVWCRATDDVVEVKLDAEPVRPSDPKAEPVKDARKHLADDPLGEPAGKGRRLFYDAADKVTSGGVSCAGCHPEGRDDGHVWHEAKLDTPHSGSGTNFLGEPDQAPSEHTARIGYPRQTPMLAGRVAANGPYGWHAESVDLNARVQAGFGLHRWGANDHDVDELIARAITIRAFLRHGLVPPPRDAHPPTPEEERGKAIFTSPVAGCIRCHVPATEYTDRGAYPFSPRLPAPAGFEEEKQQDYKTPSLFFVGGTPPYFHDGRASSLEVLVEQNGDRMGRTSQLTPEDRAALVAFLRTL